MRGDTRSPRGARDARDWDWLLLRLGAQGGGAHGPFGSLSRSCKYRDIKERKWGERTKRDLKYDHKNVFLWGQFEVVGEEWGHPCTSKQRRTIT